MDRDYKNLGRQGTLSCTVGMWPLGESTAIRRLYDAKMRQAGTKTKPCYICKGMGRVDGKRCDACNGTGSLPTA